MSISSKLQSSILGGLAKNLMPLLARTPTIFGDPNRVKVAPTAKIVNALLNVQSGNIVIEDFVFFGHNVCLLTGSHDTSRPGNERANAVITDGRDIYIEESVWLTSNVTVIGPCTIGRNSIVLPGSVVNKDIPSDSIYGGIPAQFIKLVS